MAKRKGRKEVESEQFHATVVSLLRITDAEYTHFEEKWLVNEAQRPTAYIYSTTEREILNQIIPCARSFTHYAEYSVEELANIAYDSVGYFDEDDQEFIKELVIGGATSLRLRRLSRLASIARCVADIPYDSEVEELMRTTRRRDSGVFGIDDAGATPWR
jgi:hypothetical protein